MTLALRWKICIGQIFSLPRDSLLKPDCPTQDENKLKEMLLVYETGNYSSLGDLGNAENSSSVVRLRSLADRGIAGRSILD